MGNSCNYCTWCKERSYKKQSEDFDVKRTEYPEALHTSQHSMAFIDKSIENSDPLLSESVSSIDFYPNSLETSSKDFQQSLPKQTLSLNTINEITDSEINEFLASNLLDTEDFSRVNLTIPGNISIDLLMKSNLHANTENIYRGESDSEGRPHGRGIKIDESGKYIGYFYEGVPHGIGRLVTPNGDIYQGEFRKGKIHGNAIYTTQSGGTFEGTFIKGHLTGSGRENWVNGTEYEGEYYKNMHHGQGKLKLSDGSMYIGEFNSDMAFGKGKKIWDDNSFYQGEWKDNAMHGKGEFHYSNGAIFQGNYSNNLMQGYGKLILPSQKVLEGEWKQEDSKKVVFFDTKLKKEIVIEEAELDLLEDWD